MQEQENTSTMSKRKKIVYSVILAVCVLLLVAATCLTVYFVSGGGSEVLENPPIDEPNEPSGPSDPGPEEPGEPSGPSEPEQNEPSDPSGGGDRVAYIAPIENAACTVEYYEIYNNTTLNNWTRHMAMDLAAAEGTAVRAMGDGKIVRVSVSAELGNLIEIEHEGGIVTLYRFVEPTDGLRAGDTVKQGQTIGAVASAYGTEEKDGTHLHLEMKLNGKNVDPGDYIDVTLEEK